MPMKNECTRREFLATSSAGFASAALIPRHVLGGPGFVTPGDRITTACIGVGSQGFRVLMDLLRYEDIQIVSVCDPNRGSDNFIEWGKGELRRKVRGLLSDASWGGKGEGAICGREPAQDVVRRYYGSKPDQPKSCSAYADYRELLDQEKDLDAVVVCTPDHLHAIISIAAMKKGKHVFCQKPMTRTVFEAREMGRIARETGVATQVATGNSASEETRILTEWVSDGAIGSVREVHNWSARPFWPQGIDRPVETPPVPEYLDWNLWLGPAYDRPYHPVYQPFVWRGWIDFGGGAIGDMGCYSFDTIFRVLQLQQPLTVEASGSSEWVVDGSATREKVHSETFPRASRMHFKFGARRQLPALDVYWYDGGLMPDCPSELDEMPSLPNEGMLLVGDDGKMLCGFNGDRPRLLPKSRMDSYERPPRTLPRSPGHYEEWIQGCQGKGQPGAHFEFAALVTETILLGNVAYQTGEILHWDAARLTATNNDSVSGFVNPPYRPSWSL